MCYDKDKRDVPTWKLDKKRHASAQPYKRKKINIKNYDNEEL